MTLLVDPAVADGERATMRSGRRAAQESRGIRSAQKGRRFSTARIRTRYTAALQVGRFVAALVAVLLVAVASLPAEAARHERITQKSMAPLGIEVLFESAPEPGRPVRIRLRLTPAFALDDVRIVLDADEALVVLEPIGDVLIGALGAGETEALPVEVLPLIEGRHHVRVFVTADSARGDFARPLVIPVVAGDPEASPAAADVEAGTDGTAPVRSMPAHETVH